MTTATATRAASATTSRRLNLAGVIRSEWIKATSLRSIRWSIAVSIVLGIGMSTIMGFAIRDLIPSGTFGGAEFITTVTGFPSAFLALVFAVLGVFVFSSEYSSGMILSTLTAAPLRGRVLAAKALVLTAISGAVAALILTAGVGIAVVLLPDAASALGTTEVISSLFGTLAYLVAIALMAFAIAGIVRSTAGAVTTVVAIVFLLPMIAQILTQVTDWTWVVWLNEYLPSALGSTLSYGIGSEIPSMVAEQSGVHVPQYWEALGGLVLWVVVPMIVSVKLFFDRDAK